MPKTHDISAAVTQGKLEAQHGVVMLLTEAPSRTRTHIQDRQGKIALGAREQHGILTAHCGHSWSRVGSAHLAAERATKLTGAKAPLCEDCIAKARKVFHPGLFQGLPDG